MREELVDLFGERLAAVRARIGAAARRVGREPESVKLVAISKTFGVEAMRAAVAAGQRCLGENRVQEALGKIETLGPEVEALGVEIEWHLVGHLQRNKVNAVVGRFALIHSVDSVRLIEALERRAAELGVVQPVLLQVNVAGEGSKQGAAPEGLGPLVEAMERSEQLELQGLMTMAPYSDQAEHSRPYFAQLRELLATLPARGTVRPWELSMGMSDDYKVAVEEGATLVRVGSALFGVRA